MELNLLEWNENRCKFSPASAFFAARICNLHLIFVSIPSHIVDSFVIVSLFLLSCHYFTILFYSINLELTSPRNLLHAPHRQVWLDHVIHLGPFFVMRISC